MSVLNVSACGTSEFFRVTSDGIPFGRGFGLCGSRSDRGGSTYTSGQGSVTRSSGYVCDKPYHPTGDRLARRSASFL
jgi:hypothetical protein